MLEMIKLPHTGGELDKDLLSICTGIQDVDAGID
jgi:hypothetical protein